MLYKFYFINLNKSTERREFMEDQFKKLNIPITRITATYGRDLESDFLKKEKQKHTYLSTFSITK